MAFDAVPAFGGAAAAAPSSGHQWKYDVFLSFRGSDTRNSFVSHLHHALVQKGMKTFVDAEPLERGGSIAEGILRAIEESRLSIVVFSKNYTCSRWCLDELVHILKCMDTQKQIVAPVFYQVDPSQIRNIEIEHTEEDDSDTGMEDVRMQIWRSAVETATNISGWVSRDYGNDANLIVEITDYVSNKFNISSSKANVLVGMDSHIGNVNSLLCTGVDDVRVVGICGMGGIGKTTIARAVYEKIAYQFKARWFLENVKGFPMNGLVEWQKDLLSGILEENVQSLGTLERGSKVMMPRVRREKVLLVLDDVDNLAQIEILLGNLHSFGSGSRIMITSRDKHVLVSNGVNLIYEPKLLSYYGALEMFKEHAFRGTEPTKDHHHLLSRAIEYAKGLPLALKVLGAFLNDKSVREWEDVLEKMKNIPNIGIQGVLKTSFDGLKDLEKKIFLDIACFFRGMHREYATKVLESCGFFPHVGLPVLVERALVIISPDDTLEMHDLIKEMGWDIIRQESIEEPGRRSRLWLHDDVFHVLSKKTATSSVESLAMDFSNSREPSMIDPEAFVKMKNLRLFSVKDQYHSIRYQDIDISRMDSSFPSHKLSCLLWHGCPLTCFPSNFRAKHLVDLDMQYSRFQQLWAGTKRMTMLTFINLSHCEYLEKTPDFSAVPNLQKLILDDCLSLVEVHPSISFLETLEIFSLKRCTGLSIFPSRIFMKSLKTLNLSGCSNFEKFPEIVGIMGKLSELDLAGTGIKELLPSIQNLTGLVILNLKDCGQLTRLPRTIIQLESLTQVILSGCTKLVEFENPGKHE